MLKRRSENCRWTQYPALFGGPVESLPRTGFALWCTGFAWQPDDRQLASNNKLCYQYYSVCQEIEDGHRRRRVVCLTQARSRRGICTFPQDAVTVLGTSLLAGIWFSIHPYSFLQTINISNETSTPPQTTTTTLLSGLKSGNSLLNRPS